MGVMHRPRDGRQQLGRALRDHCRQRGSVLGEAAALDQLHAEVMLALVLADLVDRHDVGMIEIGRGLRLGVEALHVGGGGQLAGKDHLESDRCG